MDPQRRFKSAFWRLHLNADTTLRSAVIVELNGISYLIISIRMPFGGSPFPSVFGITADLVTDTIDDLLNDKNWENIILYSDKAKEIPPPIHLKISISPLPKPGALVWIFKTKTVEKLTSMSMI